MYEQLHYRIPHHISSIEYEHHTTYIATVLDISVAAALLPLLLFLRYLVDKKEVRGHGTDSNNTRLEWKNASA